MKGGGRLLGTIELMMSGRKRRRIETSPQNEGPAVSDENIQSPEIIQVHKTSSIAFEGNTAHVYLEPGQLLVFDGVAYVRLLEGNSSFLGHSLVCGVQVLVHSDSNSCSALTFESWSEHGCELEFQALQDDSFKLELVQHQEADGLKKTTLNPTIIPSTWCTTADFIIQEKQSNPPIILVCGAKGAGKSTFGRFMVNKLLERHKSVAYLDTDVGQPEFTIPGCLSLHVLEAPVTGPPVLQLRDPERCFFYGDISSKTDPEWYMKLIVKLYDYFRRQYYVDSQRLPLVVNTPGWLKGIGYDVLVDILRYTVPTHVVKIGDTDLPAGHFWDTAEGQSSTTITSVERRSMDEPRCVTTPAELRALRIVAYFQQCVDKSPVLPPILGEYTSDALADIVPYQVSSADVNVVHLHIQVPASQNLYSLNAQLVGLGISIKGSEGEHECVGFGLIRGVDTISNTLYMLSPCSLELLQKVDTILHGRVELPAALLQGKVYVSPYLCRQSMLVDGTGASILHRRRKQTKKKKTVHRLIKEAKFQRAEQVH